MHPLEAERFIAAARHQLRQGNARRAVEILRQLLAADPDHADAHAVLAICLLELRRAHAAEHEAGIALALDPDSLSAVHAAAVAATARRKLDRAEEHYRRLLERLPELAAAHLGLAHVLELSGRRAAALPHLEKALALDPEDPDVLAALGEHHLRGGDLGPAEERARQALELEPEHQDALILMGHLLLRRGRVAEAKEHAIWALRHDPSHRAALYLMAAVKARSNPFLGLWWRWSTWMGTLGDGRAILVLLAAYALYRVGVISADVAGQAELAQALSWVWLALVAYTWLGPGIFRRALARELQQVELGEEF